MPRKIARRRLKAGVEQADVVLVFGSKNSSNSIRLTEVAAEFGRPTHLVDSVAELDRDWFRGDETVLITAGASAPEDLVWSALSILSSEFGPPSSIWPCGRRTSSFRCRMRFVRCRRVDIPATTATQ